MIEIRILAEGKLAQPLADKLHHICKDNEQAYRVLQAMLASPMFFDENLWGTPLIATHLRNIGMEKPFINTDGHYVSYWYWVLPIAKYMRSIMNTGKTNVPAFEWETEPLKYKYPDTGGGWTNATVPTQARPYGVRERQYPYIVYKLEREETERFYRKTEQQGFGTTEGTYLIENGDPENFLDEEGREIDLDFNEPYYLNEDVDHEIYDCSLKVVSLMLYETVIRVHDLDEACPMDTEDVQEFVDDILDGGNEDWLI